MNIKNRQEHPYHLVDASPWPILMSMGVLGGGMSIVGLITHMEINIKLALITIILISILWWRDVRREAIGGYHTTKVQRGILIGFILFLISEIMLFASFFWAFFHASLAPAIDLGSIWPPEGIYVVNTWSIPLLGTSVLLASGFILTLGHHAIISGQKELSLITLMITIILGILFTIIQATEYNYGEFTIADSIYGTVFYCTTGLHAIHVIVGIIFITVGLLRLEKEELTTEHHIGMEFAIYYWHLVDIIWLLVFIIYYYWGT